MALYPFLKRIELLVGVLFITLFLLNILKISLRYFWGISWLWVPDFSRLVFIWAIFLGTSVLYARRAIFLFILIIEGFKVSIIRMRIPFDMWNIPTGYAYAAVPVCSAIMFVTTISKLSNDFIKRRRIWKI
ncbi:hypothetical protein B6228_04450 [Candidatus Atribacteria bacterium 4572_76]|nr:MAG: hypothetical protein B6228_04450 [Candidatus Atribacteria bacterium 4572_76]